MGIYFLRLLAGLIAFGVGVFFTIYYLSFNEAEICFVKNRNQIKLNTSSLNQVKSGKVEFIFKKFTQDDNYKSADFVLRNGTDNDIYYFGHYVGGYCAVDYKQKGKVKTSPPCCGTGLEKRNVKSGDEQIFTVLLVDWEDANQVGFKFFDENKVNTIVWSDKF